MSFTSQVKDELAGIKGECEECAISLCAALVRIEGNLVFKGAGRFELEVVTDLFQVARSVVFFMQDTCGLQVEIVSRRNVLHKTPNWLIRIPAQPPLNDVLSELGVINGQGGLELSIAPHLIERDCCAKAYLRGAFMGSGFVGSPEGDAHFEMTYSSQAMADSIVDLLERFGVHAKSMMRRNTYVVYLKRRSAIKLFMELVGATHAVEVLDRARETKSMRNEVNRRVNAELANQAKTTNAAIEQLRTIQLVLRHQDIRELPEALQTYIRLRARHPDATLRELGAMCDPPLTKSAIYHRVSRLEQIANKYR